MAEIIEKIIAITPMISVTLWRSSKKPMSGMSGIKPLPIALNTGSRMMMVPVPMVTSSNAPRKIKPAAIVETKAGTPNLAIGREVSSPESAPKISTTGMTA